MGSGTFEIGKKKKIGCLVFLLAGGLLAFIIILSMAIKVCGKDYYCLDYDTVAHSVRHKVYEGGRYWLGQNMRW